jgi:BMFP domain-containing protein YqiC
MQSQNKIFEDLSKVATSALGTFAGLGREVETQVRGRVKDMVGGLDMVSRDEFEAVREMAANARATVDAQGKLIAALQAEIAALKAPPASPVPRKGKVIKV